MRTGKDPADPRVQAALSIQTAGRAYLARKSQAALRIQKAYKAYRLKKNTLYKLPQEKIDFMREKTAREPGHEFLLSNLKPDDYFLISHAGSKLLMRQLNAGNYQLLLFYLRNGHAFLPHIYEAFFNGNCSIEILEFVSFLQSMAPLLTQAKCPGDKVDCFPILDQSNCFSTLEARRLLVPYLQQNFKTVDSHARLLHAFAKTLPLSERVFAIIELSFEFHLASMKMILLRMAKEKSLASYCGFLGRLSLYAQILKMAEAPTPLTLLFDELIATKIVNEVLVNETLGQLELYYPFTSSYTRTNHLYFQIVFAYHVITTPILWHGRISQLIVGPSFLNRYAHFIFSQSPNKHHEAIIASPGFGEFTATNIKEAMQANTRIISLESPHIKIQNLVHDAADGLPANTLHDLGHLVRMCMTPFSLRKGLEAWADLVHRTIQFPLSKMTYHLLDMDIAGFTDMTSATQNNLTENMKAIVTFYKRPMKFLPRYLEYQLIITFEMLRDPHVIHNMFSHCEKVCSATELQDLFMTALCPESDLHFGNTVSYKNIKNDFQPQFSNTQNVFFYLLNEAVKSKKLDAEKQENLISLVTQLDNVLKWTRNSGLKIVGFYVRDINNQNYDAVMSALKILALMQDKIELVQAITLQELTQLDSTQSPFAVPALEIDEFVEDTPTYSQNSVTQYYKQPGTGVFFSRAVEETRHTASSLSAASPMM